MCKRLEPAAPRIVLDLNTAEEIIERVLTFERYRSRTRSSAHGRSRDGEAKVAVVIHTRNIRLHTEITTDVVDTGSVETVKGLALVDVDTEFLVIDVSESGIDLAI